MTDDRVRFMEWFMGLLRACPTCVMRDVLREQKENLYKQWLIEKPYEDGPDDKSLLNLDELRDLIEELQDEAQDLACDDKRGHWGTKAESALAALCDDLGDAVDQIDYIRELREGKKRG